MKKSNFLKKCGWLLGCVFAVAAFSACSDDGTDGVTEFIPGDGFTENITLLPEKGSQSIKFTAGTDWTAKSNQAWLKLDGQESTGGRVGGAEIYVGYEENKDVVDRPATIVLTAGATVKTINVLQKGAGRVIAYKGVSGDTLKMQKEVTEYNAEILANLEWEYVADSLSTADREWIEVAGKDGKLAIKILNQDGLARCARIVLRDKNSVSFTKALFVEVEGWGEEYLTWSIDEKMFTEGKDTAMITATFVADVEPRALVIKGNDTLAEKAGWISFQLLPAPKSAVQEKRWEMIVENYTDIEDRMALVVLVSPDMTDSEVKAQLKNLKSEKVLQSNNLPAIKYGIWRYDYVVDENGNMVNNEDGLPYKDYIWSGYSTDGMVEFKMMETTVAIQIFANRAVDNLRFVKLNTDGTESALDYSPMGSGYVKGDFRDPEGHTVVDIAIEMKVFVAGVGGRLSNWMALDMLDENGSKIKTVYLELVQTTKM